MRALIYARDKFRNIWKKKKRKKERILTVGKTHIDFIQIEKNT